MAIAEITIVPIGVSDPGLSRYVVNALEVVRESGLHFELTAMGTIISGDLDEIWGVLRKVHESCFTLGAPRVLTQIRIDDRRDRVGSPEQKVRSVLEKLSTRENSNA
jgi:uncharacterized protein (TIGR00106 family)